MTGIRHTYLNYGTGSMAEEGASRIGTGWWALRPGGHSRSLTCYYSVVAD